MDFFDLKNISERYMEILNPSTSEKILKVGEISGLKEGSRVIEFGCGFGEILALWGGAFGISGVGIDIRQYACDRARKKMRDRELADRIEIVWGKGAEYDFEKGSYDVAACIGASFVFGGYRETIRGMKIATGSRGKLVIGEPYWRTELIPPVYARAEVQGVHTESELWHITREEGFDIGYVVRASHDDWDRYQSDNWYGLIRWIEENPDHPERQQVIDHLHQDQEEYFRYGREYLDWAMYVLVPICY
jgi:SAM-dependent methyltransferase